MSAATRAAGWNGRATARARAHLEASGLPLVCWLCLRPIVGPYDVDHAIPLSVAPELAHDPANWRPAHRTCNRSRGNRPPDRHRPAGNLVQPVELSPRWTK